MLIYDYTDDYLARRAEFRQAHLALAWEAAARGEFLVGGALGDHEAGLPLTQAMLLFQGDGPEAAERFARADPYVANGLVRAWRVLPWQTVAGPLAANPIRLPE